LKKTIQSREVDSKPKMSFAFKFQPPAQPLARKSGNASRTAQAKYDEPSKNIGGKAQMALNAAKIQEAMPGAAVIAFRVPRRTHLPCRQQRSTREIYADVPARSGRLTNPSEW
jgi:hypothetical protein